MDVVSNQILVHFSVQGLSEHGFDSESGEDFFSEVDDLLEEFGSEFLEAHLFKFLEIFLIGEGANKGLAISVSEKFSQAFSDLIFLLD